MPELSSRKRPARPANKRRPIDDAARRERESGPAVGPSQAPELPAPPGTSPERAAPHQPSIRGHGAPGSESPDSRLRLAPCRARIRCMYSTFD